MPSSAPTLIGRREVPWKSNTGLPAGPYDGMFGKDRADYLTGAELGHGRHPHGTYLLRLPTVRGLRTLARNEISALANPVAGNRRIARSMISLAM